MSTRIRSTQPRPRTEESQRPEMTELAERDAARDDRPPVTDEDLDEFLAEVDRVLEENAEAFVAGFVQRGGE